MKGIPHVPYILLAILMFAASLATPALKLSEGEVYSGLELILVGWYAIPYGTLGWCANPLLMVSLALFLSRQWTIAIVSTALTILASLTTFTLWFLPVHGQGFSRRGFVYYLSRPEVGFFLWVGSMLVIGIGAVIFRRKSSRKVSAA